MVFIITQSKQNKATFQQNKKVIKCFWQFFVQQRDTESISSELIEETMAFTGATFVVFFAVTALTQGKNKGITYYWLSLYKIIQERAIITSDNKSEFPKRLLIISRKIFEFCSFQQISWELRKEKPN